MTGSRPAFLTYPRPSPDAVTTAPATYPSVSTEGVPLKRQFSKHGRRLSSLYKVRFARALPTKDPLTTR